MPDILDIARVTPDLLSEVRAALQGRTIAELKFMATEIEDVSFSWLYHVKRGAYRSEPGTERVRRVHAWLAVHPLPIKPSSPPAQQQDAVQ